MNKVIALTILALTAFSGLASASIYDDTTTYYDQYGIKKGSSRKGYGPLNEDTITYYDQYGIKTGSARKGYGPLNEDTTTYYDQYGIKKGSARKGFSY